MADTVPALLRPALQTALEEIQAIEAQAEAVRTQPTQLAELMPDAQLLLTIPGVGILTATALVAFVGDIHRFRSGRDFAAYLGLTPRGTKAQVETAAGVPEKVTRPATSLRCRHALVRQRQMKHSLRVCQPAR
jgi:transposase